MEETQESSADNPTTTSSRSRITEGRNRNHVEASSSTNGYNREARHKSGRCPECGKLMRLSELEKHVKSHLQERPYACPECPKTFAERASLGRHKLVHSRGDLYECTVCKKNFRGIAAVKAHKKTHAKKNVDVVLVKEEKEEPVRVKVTLSPPKEIEKFDEPAPTQPVKTSPPTRSPPIPNPSPPLPKSGTALTYNGNRRQSQKQVVLMNSIRKKYNLPLSKYIMPNNQEQCFPCQFCPQQFSTLRLRTRHVLHYHKGNFPYQCEFCDKSFLRSSSLTQHSTFHTDERPFKCNMCVASFRYHSNLYSHRFTHKEYGSLLCTVCGQSFRHSTTLWSHVQKHRQEMVGSGVGVSSFGLGRGRKSKLTQVIRYSDEEVHPQVKVEVTDPSDSVSDPTPAPAEEFEYHTPTFLTGEDVDMIMNTAEEANSEDQDQDLPRIFIKKEIFEPELNLKAPVPEFRVKMPPPPPLIPIKREFGFQHPPTMQLIPKPKTASPEITMCPICYKSFPLNYLQFHMQVHTENKPYQCQYCEKSYSKRFEVIQHEYSHTGERPYSCDDCGNTFRYKSNWCRHRRAQRVRGRCEGRLGGRQLLPSGEYENENEEEDDSYVTDQSHYPEISINSQPEVKGPWEMFKLAARGEANDDEDDGDGDAVSDAPSSVDPLSGELTSGSESRIQQLFNLPDLIIDEVEILDDEDEYEVQDDPWSRQQQQQQQIQYYRSHTHLQPRKVTAAVASASGRMPMMSPAPQPQRRNKQQFWCSTCQKGFGSDRHLAFHKRQHAKDRRVTCKICNKTFAHRFSLTQHALVHTGEMPFNCEMCNKQFRFKSNYTKHNKQHHPELVLQLPPQQYASAPTRIGQNGSQLQQQRQNQMSVQLQQQQRQGQGQMSIQLQNRVQAQLPPQLQQRPRQIQINSHITPNQQQRQVQIAPQLQQQLAHVLPDLKKKPVTEEVKEQSHKCEYCEEEFEDSSELRLHVLSHKLGLSYVRTRSINVE